MKKLAIIFVATASLAGTALACPNSEHEGKTAEKAEKPAPKAADKEQPKETAKAEKPAKAEKTDAAPAQAPKKADKVSSK